MKKSVIGILAALVTLSGCGPEVKQQEQEKKPPVKVATAAAQSIEQQADFTGNIEPFLLNNISPSLGLRIDKIHVDVGDRVSKGQLLVEMDKRQYLQAAVQLSNIQTDYLRTEKLYQEGGVSKQQLDQLETQLTVSKHATENLRENADLESPINGIITERSYDPGDVYSVQSGKILTVMQLDRVKIHVNVSELYFPLVKVGMPVDIKLDVYPSESFQGKVSLVYPALDAATRTFTIEITIPNTGGKLRPGMFSRVTLNLGQANHVMVPDIAVQKQIGTNERYVFVVDANNKVARRTVTVGRVIGNDYEILSGINDADVVVIAGAQKLLDGTEVEITK